MTDPYAPPDEPTSTTSDLPSSDKTTMLLVLAGVSYLACGPIAAIPGLFIARTERERIARREIAPDGTIDVAYWLFVANIVLFVVSLIFAVVVVFGSVWIIDTHGHH